MLHSPIQPAGAARPAHVIVCGNEKGGSGKSTLAIHVAVALMRAGRRVGTVDLDGRQLSITRFFENRQRRAARHGGGMPLPAHFHVPPVRRDTVAAAEGYEAEELTRALARLADCDYVVIDTPGSDTFLNRLAHRVADTLITPTNDSFVDFDVLARIDPERLQVVEYSQYALAVRDARRERRLADSALLDWVVVRNRMASIASRNERKVDACLRPLSMQLGFRLADGIAERVAFRELFPLGLTVLDDCEDLFPGGKATASHQAARHEIARLVSALRLPDDDTGGRRAAARRRFAELVGRAPSLPDIFAG